MKPVFFSLLLGSAVLVTGVFVFGVQSADSLECSWTESTYRCTDGYWTSQYQCTWYDPAPYQSCTPSTTYETQCGWEVQCDADDTNCDLVRVCTRVAVPSQNCTTVDPAPYQICEWDTVWVPGSCGNYPTYKTQTCPANSETSCSYATECSTSGTKNVTSYSCGSSGCVASTSTATCSRTFPSCTNNVGETGVVCGGSCTAPANATVSLAANPSTSTVNNGTSVSYTATSSRDVGPTLYYIRIYEGSTQRKTCSTGTTCSYSTSDNNTTRTFVGKIEDLNGSVVAATSNSVSTTWIKIATQLPDANFSFNPTAVVQGKSTTVSGWLTTSTGAGIGGKTIVLQCWNGTDWPQVASGSTENTDPDTGFTSFSWTPTSSWKGDISCRLNFAGDTTYASSASGQKTITVTPTAQCAAPQPKIPPCSYNSSANTLTFSWDAVTDAKSYFIEWTKWGSSYTFCLVPGCTPDSKTVNTASGTTSSLDKNTNYKLHVRAETSGSACATPGLFSADIECYTGTCPKTSTARNDSFMVPVQTMDGTKNCTVTATHSGRDYYDSAQGKYDTNVSYQETACQRDLTTSSSNIQDISCQANSTTNSSTIAMDDNPVTGCNNNLVFTNSFGIPSTGTLNATSEVNSKDAGHDLSFGYELTTSQCVITGVQGSGSTTITPDGSYWDRTQLKFSPVISADKKSASYQQAIYNNTSSTSQTSNFTFTLKECTQDSHCSADPNKAYCNVSGGTRNVSAFPQNTCIDSVNPTTTIGAESQFQNTTSNNAAPGYRASDDTWWLKQGTWSIPITDSDTGGAGIDTTKCAFVVDDLGRTIDNPNGNSNQDPADRSRTCSSSITITVGPTGDCQTQGKIECQIKVKTTDKANNSSTIQVQKLNIDYTAPTAQ